MVFSIFLGRMHSEKSFSSKYELFIRERKDDSVQEAKSPEEDPKSLETPSQEAELGPRQKCQYAPSFQNHWELATSLCLLEGLATSSPALCDQWSLLNYSKPVPPGSVGCGQGN